MYKHINFDFFSVLVSAVKSYLCQSLKRAPDKDFNIKDVCSKAEVDSLWSTVKHINYVISPDIKKIIIITAYKLFNTRAIQKLTSDWSQCG